MRLGMIELEAAGAAIFAEDVGVVAVGDVNHGGGDVNHGDGVVVRQFSDEEMSAARWKCHLDKASPEIVCNVARGLPEWSIQQATREYRSRSAPSKPAERPSFLLSRDARLNDRENASRHFLQWCKDRHGDPLPLRAAALLANGRMPRGWFQVYKDAPDVLQRIRGQARRQYASVQRVLGASHARGVRTL